MSRTVTIRVIGDAASARRALGDTSTAASKLGDTVQAKVRPATSTLSRLWGEARRLAVPLTGLGLASQTLFAGFNRVRNIDTARAKLQALGHDTESTAAIMDSALESVTGTAFSLADAATAASTAVAAGVQPGEELTRYLSLIGDAAHVAGVGMNDLASIINKTTTAGRVGTQELNQLADRGIPIWTWLADAIGVTGEELRKMVSQGKVDSETLLRAIEDNIGGAAKSANDSWSGLVSNLGAAQARLGAAIIDPLFQLGKQVLPTAIEGVNKLTDGVSLLSGFIQGDGLPLAAAAAAAFTFAKAVQFASVQVPLLTTRLGLATLAIKAKVTAMMSLAAAHPVITALTIAAGALTFAWMSGRRRAEEQRKAVGDLAGEMRRLGDTYAATADQAEQLLESQDTSNTALRQSMIEVGLQSDDLAEALHGTNEQWEAFVARVLDGAEAAGVTGLELARMARLLEDQRNITQDAIVTHGELGEVITDTGDAADEATPPTESLARSWQTAAEKAEDARQALRDLQREMDEYLGRVFGARNAESQWFDSLDRLREGIRDHGRDLDLTTEAGRRNEEAIQRLISAGKDQLQQMIDDDATTVELIRKKRELADELEAVLRQMGFTEEQAKTYADALRGIPTSVFTRIDLDDSALARAESRLRTITNNLPSGRSLGSLMHQGRATGGPTSAGDWHMVGEQGRELVYMPSRGMVFSHQVTERVLSGAAPGSGRSTRPSGPAGPLIGNLTVVANSRAEGARAGRAVVGELEKYQGRNRR